jgi:hypothetical protein
MKVSASKSATSPSCETLAASLKRIRQINMKKIILLLFTIIFQSCFICPEKQSLEYTKSTKTIKILSKDYYIKSIRITEYLPKENYIETIDSNYVELIQKGARGATEMSLENNYENYVIKNKSDFEQFLKKDYLEFIIKLEKFENKKDGNFDNEIIRFVSTEITSEKNIFKSNHPCP